MDRQISQVNMMQPRRFGLPQVGLLVGAFATAVALAYAFRPGRSPKIDIPPVQIESSVRPQAGPVAPPAPAASPLLDKDEAQRQLADAMARFAANGQRDTIPAPGATAPVAPAAPAAAPTASAPIVASGDAGVVSASSPRPAAPAAPAPAAQAPAAPSVVAALPAAPPPPVVEMTAPTPSIPPLSEADMRRLADKAAQAIRDGDIFGARLILERAMAAGDATAIFALAETYDPKVLGRMNVKGVKGDAVRAKALYTQALDKGMAEARARIDALDR